MEKIKLIHDCDPGHDDAVALLMAARSPKLELLGVTVVAGNQTLDNTVRNACNVLQWVDSEVPVYAGCSRPMVREKVIAADIHGSTGLDGPVFPENRKKPEKQHAVLYLIETLLASEGDITVVTTGPMTNLAMAIRMEPRIVPKIRQIVLMGGSIGNGNVSPAAEFNILADAEAAHVCFSCGRPIVMFGLDVTRQVLCYPEIVERMKRLENRGSQLFAELMAHFCASQKVVFGWEGGPLHDPCTMAWLLHPEIFTLQEMNVRIDYKSEQSYGRTNCDAFDYLHLPHNARVAVAVDVPAFWDCVEECLRNYAE